MRLSDLAGSKFFIPSNETASVGFVFIFPNASRRALPGLPQPFPLPGEGLLLPNLSPPLSHSAPIFAPDRKTNRQHRALKCRRSTRFGLKPIVDASRKWRRRCDVGVTSAEAAEAARNRMFRRLPFGADRASGPAGCRISRFRSNPARKTSSL